MKTRNTWAIVCAMAMMVANVAQAADGTWTLNNAGNWSTTNNWSGGTVADGADFTATLGDVITADRAITLDSVRAIGGITVLDTSHNYTITSSKLTLDVTAGNPTLTVPSGRTLTISSVIAGSDGLTKTGVGTLTLSGNPNQFTGNTVISGGKVALGAQYALWQSAYDTTGSTGTIGLDRSAQATPWLGGLAGSVDLATAITGYSGITSLTLNPQFGSSVSYGGVIANGAANMTLNKSGHGTQTLTSANTYSGATTVWAGTLGLGGASGSALNSAFTVKGGTLLLDNSGGTWANRLTDGTAISLGSLTLKSYDGAGAQTETIGATTLATSGKITVDNGTGAGTTLAVNGTVTRAANSGVAIDFVGTGGTLGSGTGNPNVTATTLPSNANGILPWATVNGTLWAENNANSVRAYSGGFVDPTTYVSSVTSNAQFTGSGTIASAKSFNSLNVIASGAGQSMSLGGILTLTSPGAILKSGSDAYSITSSVANAITAGAELIAHVDGGALTISAPLNGSIVGIAKGGTGDLILSGTRAGTMSGSISIAGGQLEFQGAGFTLSGVVTGAGGLTVNLNAGQTLTMSNNSNSYAGPTIVKGGYLTSAGYNQQGMPGGIIQTPGSSNTSQIMSNLKLEGGIFYSRYVTNKDFGAGPGQVQILGGTSGFVHDANSGGAVGCTLDGGRELVWGSTYFNPTVFVHSTVGNQTLNLANGIDLAGSTRTILVGDATYNASVGGGSSQLGGVIRTSSGTAGLTKTGVGILLLTGASTFNGVVTVSQGTLDFQGNANVASANPLGQSSAVAANLLLANGTTLRYTGGAASSDRSFTINGTADGHSASLNASGTGALVLSNTSTPAYGTVDQMRTLILTGTQTGNNTLAANIADNGAGAVSVTKTGAGLWALSGTTSSYTGPTTINQGTLSVGAAANLGGASANLVFNGGTLQITGTTLTSLTGLGRTIICNPGVTVGLDINNASNTFTNDVAITGSVNLVKLGAGTLILNTTNSYSGMTTISGGILQYNDDDLIPTTPLLNNASLVINRSSGTLTQGVDFHSIMGGTGSLNNIGTGNTLALNAINTYSGTTKATAGTIALSHPLALMNSAIDTTGAGIFTLSGVTAPTIGGLSGASGDLASVVTTGYNSVTNLILNPSGTVTYGGVIANGASGMTLTMAGSGTQVLQGVNTYSGATILKAGTLELSGSGSILTSVVTLSGGGLKLTNMAAETGSGRVHDSTGITANGGTITYNNTSGANVYAETIGAVTLARGQLNIVENTAQASTGSQTLTLGGLTQAAQAAVTFSSATTAPNTTKNMIKVTGASPTSAGQIIGPWATVGTAANAQTDYAIYNGSEQVVPAAIATSAESTWANTTDSYTRNAGLGLTTLTATRNVKALRLIASANSYVVDDYNNNYTLTSHPFVNGDAVVFSGATAPGNMTFGTIYYVVNATANNFKVSTTPGGGALDLSNGAGTSVNVTGVVLLSTGNNLGTLGILNGAASTMAIAASGTGAVTLPSTTSGNLYVNAGSGAITLAAPIKDNTGALTLVKNGSGTLALSSTSSDYSGGTIINAGALTYTADANLGASGSRNLTFNGSGNLTGFNGSSLGTLTVNSGGVATVNAANITFATTTGSGTIIFSTGGANTLSLGDASGFTGNIQNFDIYAGATIAFSKLSDSGSLQFAGGSSDSNQRETFQLAGDAGPLTMNTRQVQLLDKGAYANANRYYRLNNNNSKVANTWVINTPLLNYVATRAVEFELGGSNTGNNEFAGVIGNGYNSLMFNKVDAGTWILSGNNTFSGSVNVGGGTLFLTGINTYTGSTTANGTLSISSIANYGVNCAVGKGTVGTAIQVGGNGSTPTLIYTGGPASTDRQIMIGYGGNASGGVIYNNGTGALTFTASTFNQNATGNFSRTMTLGGTYSGSANEIQGAIINTSTAATDVLGINKTGVSIWTLSGANTFTGATAMNGGGGLILDYATQDNSKLSDTTALTLGGVSLGGILTLKGGSHEEIVSATTLGAGGTFLTRDGGTSKLRMNAITRQAGGTISFADSTIANTDANNVNGILGGWATLGNDWAVSIASGAADTAVTALSSYTGTLPTTVGANTANYTLTGSQTQGAAVLANTVKITGTGTGDTLALGGNALTITSASATSLGGILYVGGGDGNYNITSSGGNGLDASAANELVITTVTGTLNVSAKINGSGSTRSLVKTGAGTLVVSSANTYTGATYVNQGTLRIANATATGTTAGGIQVQNGAALEFANGITVGAEAITAVGTGVANGGALSNYSGTNTYTGAITLGTGGALIKSVSGMLTLGGAITTSLGNDLFFDGAGDVTVTNVISGVGRVIKNGTGTVTLTANNTYSGATLINEGTMVGVVGGSCSNSAVTVASAGTLAVSVIDNTKQWTCASLALTTDSKLTFNYSVTPSATVAPLNIKGDLTFSGTPKIVISPRIDPGTYPLLTVGGTAPTSQTLPTLSGVTGKLAWIDKTLWLTVIPQGTLIQIF